MNIKTTALFLVFSLLFLSVPPAQAAKTSPDNRYFIKSNASAWKKSFTVRNTFEDGFTADLSDWQLKLAKIFNLEFEPVGKLYVSPSRSTVAVSGTKAAKSDRIIPETQVPWGVATVYGNPDLEKSSGGKDVTIAVLDTGIVTHADLAERVADCRDFTSPKQPMVMSKCEDKNGHGTHVAGTIAADGGSDGRGIYGVAPEALLQIYKVCDANGSCWADDVALAIQTAVDEGAQIINLSLGSDKESILVHRAVDYAADHGVLVVAAAGNDGPYKGSIDYPAAQSRVISVGAIDEHAMVPDWSSRGLNDDSKSKVAEDKDLVLVAPGVNVESTWKDGYAILSGTSMATPHISGLAALLWNAGADDPAAAVWDLLTNLSSDVDEEGEDNSSGYGLPSLQ